MKQSVIIQDVKHIDLYDSKRMNTGDHSRLLQVISHDGSICNITLIGDKNHLTVNPMSITTKGKGKTV